MKQLYINLATITVLSFLTVLCPAHAQENTPTPKKEKTGCAFEDRICILDDIEQSTANMERDVERDKTFRELAKLYTQHGKSDKAIPLVTKIKNADTKAMTIRGIGMEVAKLDIPMTDKKAIMSKLRAEAEKIEHPPSHAIALTYIAMAQAYAGDDEGSWKTASDMENDSLRRKAFGETAEIQAETGKYKEAKISLQKIQDEAYQNKAFATVSKILVNIGDYKNAYDAALEITNPYKRALAMQYLLEQEAIAAEQK